MLTQTQIRKPELSVLDVRNFINSSQFDERFEAAVEDERLNWVPQLGDFEGPEYSYILEFNPVLKFVVIRTLIDDNLRYELDLMEQYQLDATAEITVRPNSLLYKMKKFDKFILSDKPDIESYLKQLKQDIKSELIAEFQKLIIGGVNYKDSRLSISYFNSRLVSETVIKNHPLDCIGAVPFEMFTADELVQFFLTPKFPAEALEDKLPGKENLGTFVWQLAGKIKYQVSLKQLKERPHDELVKQLIDSVKWQRL